MLACLQSTRHGGNAAIYDMERERPILLNVRIEIQGFPLILNETSTVQSRSVLINTPLLGMILDGHEIANGSSVAPELLPGSPGELPSIYLPSTTIADKSFAEIQSTVTFEWSTHQGN